MIYRILIYIRGCDAEVAWAGDENPLGFEVTKDMTFEAYVANKPDEIAEVRYFGTKLYPPGGNGRYYFLDLTLGYPVGYTLTERDIPLMYLYLPGNYELKWTPDPIGATVYGGEEFEAEKVEELTVIFIDPHYYGSGSDRYVLMAYFDLEYGASVEPPREDEIPQYSGEVFIGWDSDDYLYVTGYTPIYAEYRPIGDANTDNVVNLGDAAYILRHALGLTESEVHNFDKLADYNNDGTINTGDAAGVLAFAVNG